MLRNLLLIGWYIIVCVLVLAACVVGILRAYPSLYQHYLPSIQENISSIVGKPVQAETISINWHGYTPLIAVSNLAIYSDDTKQNRILFAKTARLSFDLVKSLAQKKISIHQLTLTGSNLEAVRTKNQRIILNGIDISERIENRQKLEQENKIRISLLDSSISIKDEIENLDYFFDHVDIELGFNKDRFKVASNFLLPETLGNSFSLIADVKGFDQGLNNIKGSLYAKGENINLELLYDFFPQLQVGISAGNADFEVWGDLKSTSERAFHGRLTFRDLEYKDIEKPLVFIVTGQEITALETQFQIKIKKDNWRLALINSDIQAADKNWPGHKYEINCADCSKPDFSISAALDYFDPTHLLATLQHFPVYSSQLEGLLTKAQISGGFEKTSIFTQWSNEQLVKYLYKTSLLDTTIAIPNQDFQVSSLTGEVHGNHVYGSLRIDAPAVQIQANKIADYSFLDQNIAGTVKWRHTDNGVLLALENVSLAAEGISTNMQGSIQINNGNPYIDIQGEVASAQIATLKKYLPYKKMRPKLVKWLKASLTGGVLKNGKLLFQGNPKQFPFKNHPGTFEVVASVENGILDYRKDKEWPGVRDITADLEIKNKHLTVIGHQGTILNSSINQVTAIIEDIKLPRLIIDGKTSGPVGDILDFLQQSSLIPENSQIPRHISADGNTNLDLNLILTLTKKLEKERIVNGVLEFDNTDLTVTSVALPFTGLKGKLKFNRHGAEGQDLSAKLFGSTFNAHAAKIEDGRTRLTVTGDVDLDAYFAANYEQAAKYIKGIAPISAIIDLPRFGKHDGDKSLVINIDSNLAGTAVALPEPFYKEIDENKSLNVYTKYQTGTENSLFVDFDNQAFMQIMFGKNGKQISALELRMGNKQFNPPAHGLKISGKFDQLDVSAWEDIFKPTNTKSTIKLKEVDIQANTFFVSGVEFQDLDIKLKKDAQYWSGKINSSVAKGQFHYPLDPSSANIATGTFDYLRFSKPEKKMLTVIDPRKLPALEIRSKQFKFNDYSFNDVALKTEPSTAGMIINSLTCTGDDLQITANGMWEVGAGEAHSTNLDILLVTQNIHNSLAGLGFNAAISKGQGRVSAKLNWPNTPYQFSIESFLGTAELRFKEGVISSVHPGGAGRLVGLFNLGELSKRLSLDFRDIFSKGYVFDEIRGDLLFKNSNLTTENLSIEGRSADILIVGRTGIVAKDYDQVVTVKAHVSGSLPLIGLAIAGPLGGLGTWVVEKAGKAVGMDLDKITETKYSMTGSWDDPRIEPIVQKVVKATPYAQGQPSPQPLPPNQVSEESKNSPP